TLTRPNRSKSGAADQRLWREQPGIVCSRLNRAIGAGGHYRQKVALRRLGKLAIERQIVAALADRPDHVGANALGRRRRLDYRHDVVMGFIERWPDEVVHRR